MKKTKSVRSLLLIAVVTILLCTALSSWLIVEAKAEDECDEMVACRTWSCGWTSCGNVGGAPTHCPDTIGFVSTYGAGQCALKLMWVPVIFDCACPIGKCGGEQAQTDPGC